jgi:uncharacterized protein YjiS (DUF1127 family)
MEEDEQVIADSIKDISTSKLIIIVQRWRERRRQCIENGGNRFE